MVLLQVDFPRVTIAPFERDTPGAVYVNTVALRLASKRVEIEARYLEISQRCRLFECIQPPERSRVEVRSDSSASAFAKQFVKPLVAEAPYHPASVTI